MQKKYISIGDDIMLKGNNDSFFIILIKIILTIILLPLLVLLSIGMHGFKKR